MNDSQQWTETDSQLYQHLADIAVPDRAEQLATLLTLMPFSPADTFQVVEVGSGQGFLSAALLSCYPKATLTALDGSASMRDETAKNIDPFGQRGRVAAFDLFAADWYSYLEQADVVVSSLCLHHLDDAAKRELYATISRQLTERGALLIADLVAPQRTEVNELFAATWDQAAQIRSTALANATKLFNKFQQEQWNYYRYPDPVDRPSSLFEQLLWLKEANFAVVDCFWMQAGHAIYGGYKSVTRSESVGLAFETALATAQEILKHER